ncbi:MAG: hypothetical protein IJ672_09265 [Methanobrevibacter sp.]|nr:hypothetical protein [Methanobrevibacter sp.]
MNYDESPLLLASDKQNRGYMEKKKLKYLFDISEGNSSNSYQVSEELNALDAKIKQKLQQIKTGMDK